MSGKQLEGEYEYPENEDSVVLTVETESWIELNNNAQQQQPTQNVFEESEFIEEGLNDESVLLSEVDDVYEEDTDEYTPLEQSENDLDRSLNTLLNGGEKMPLGVGHHRQHHTPRYNSSKVTLESLRLVNDNELRNNTYASSDTTCSSASTTPRTKRKRKTGNATNNQMDLSTITLAAAAGISIVAGLSFSAGYAFGRRSVVKVSA